MNSTHNTESNIASLSLTSCSRTWALARTPKPESQGPGRNLILRCTWKTPNKKYWGCVVLLPLRTDCQIRPSPWLIIDGKKKTWHFDTPLADLRWVPCLDGKLCRTTQSAALHAFSTHLLNQDCFSQTKTTAKRSTWMWTGDICAKLWFCMSCGRAWRSRPESLRRFPASLPVSNSFKLERISP